MQSHPKYDEPEKALLRERFFHELIYYSMHIGFIQLHL